MVNDLDLWVTKDGSADRIFPNGLMGPDTLNNVERVSIEKPTRGSSYTVHVEGSNIIGSQEYSLVITGCFAEESIDPPIKDDAGSNDAPSMADCADGPERFVVREGVVRGEWNYRA